MDFAKYFSVALASAIKFVGGPITGAALRLSWWETALFTIVGMMSAVTIVSLVGREIQRRVRARSSTQVKLFSRRTRLAVSVWRRFGLWGIACLTPLFLHLSVARSSPCRSSCRFGSFSCPCWFLQLYGQSFSHCSFITSPP